MDPRRPPPTLPRARRPSVQPRPGGLPEASGAGLQWPPQGGTRTTYSPDQPPSARGEALDAVSRLLAAATAADRPESLAGALVREVRAYFGVSASLVFVVDQRSRRAAAVAGDPNPAHRDWFGLDEASPLAEALDAGTPVLLSTAQARELALASGLQPRPQAALVAPMVHPGGAVAHVLLVADD